MYEEWTEYRNEEKNGMLDLAFAGKDPVMLRTCLKELRIVNQKFMELASERYAEMVRFVQS